MGIEFFGETITSLKSPVRREREVLPIMDIKNLCPIPLQQGAELGDTLLLKTWLRDLLLQ
jgi:hypothetical protein